MDALFNAMSANEVDLEKPNTLLPPELPTETVANSADTLLLTLYAARLGGLTRSRMGFGSITDSPLRVPIKTSA